MLTIHANISIAACLLTGLTQAQLHAQHVPLDVGQTVSGYQDDFNGTVRNAQWVAHGPGGDLYLQDNGVLRATTSAGDPNHLLYEASGYNDAEQEVLARIRFITFTGGANPRGGISVGINPDSSQGNNFMFRDWNNQAIDGQTRHLRLLDDFRAWGPGTPVDWKENTWYWLRLRQTASSTASGNNIQGKVWLADGTVSEPADWQLSWGRNDRGGFAGIAGSSGGGTEEFEVDYLLIKAEGLPSIKVNPSAFSGQFTQIPVIRLIAHPRDATVEKGRTATFTVEATASAAPSYQWQKAASGSTNFADIAGAASMSYTTPVLTEADNGAQYRAVISIPGLSRASNAATVITDVTKPTVLSARTLGDPNKVTVVFSEPVRSNASRANFTIDNGIDVTGARPGTDPAVYELTTSAITLGKTYKLTVNGVQDLIGNDIQAASQITLNLFVELPVDFGQTVNGFQDDFTGAARDPNWVAVGPGGDLYEQANGVLKVTASMGDPNHLLYAAPGYNDATQEVLAHIRIKAFGQGDGPRGGIGVGVNADNSQGIELHFRNSDFNETGTRFRLLDDLRAWGPAIQTKWTTNAWFWLRLRQTSSSTAAGTNIHAKVWLADGSVPEPANWQAGWSRAGRTGLAGITGSSGGGAEEFDVDYVLIKAAGLPSIKVAPAPFALVGPRPEPEPGASRFTRLAKLADNRLVLEWTGSGVFEEADNIAGPWTAVAGAASPRTITASGTRKFYRLR